MGLELAQALAMGGIAHHHQNHGNQGGSYHGSHNHSNNANGKGGGASSSESEEDWEDESWTVDCPCGVTYDDGDEMVACDECEVWVHTKCCRVPKGLPEYVCDKCKVKKGKESEETEVAQLLMELPGKTVAFEERLSEKSAVHSYPGPGRNGNLLMEMPIEERVHVQGVPGGDPALFSGFSKAFSRQLWMSTGYVPKLLNFQYVEFPDCHPDSIPEYCAFGTKKKQAESQLQALKKVECKESGHDKVAERHPEGHEEVNNENAPSNKDKQVKSEFRKSDRQHKHKQKFRVAKEEKASHFHSHVKREAKDHGGKKKSRNNSETWKAEGERVRKTQSHKQEGSTKFQIAESSPKNPKTMKKSAVQEYMDVDTQTCSKCLKTMDINTMDHDCEANLAILQEAEKMNALALHACNIATAEKEGGDSRLLELATITGEMEVEFRMHQQADVLTGQKKGAACMEQDHKHHEGNGSLMAQKSKYLKTSILDAIPKKGYHDEKQLEESKATLHGVQEELEPSKNFKVHRGTLSSLAVAAAAMSDAAQIASPTEDENAIGCGAETHMEMDERVNMSLKDKQKLSTPSYLSKNLHQDTEEPMEAAHKTKGQHEESGNELRAKKKGHLMLEIQDIANEEAQEPSVSVVHSEKQDPKVASSSHMVDHHNTNKKVPPSLKYDVSSPDSISPAVPQSNNPLHGSNICGPSVAGPPRASNIGSLLKPTLPSILVPGLKAEQGTSKLSPGSPTTSKTSPSEVSKDWNGSTKLSNASTACYNKSNLGTKVSSTSGGLKAAAQKQIGKTSNFSTAKKIDGINKSTKVLDMSPPKSIISQGSVSMSKDNLKHSKQLSAAKPSTSVAIAKVSSSSSATKGSNAQPSSKSLPGQSCTRKNASNLSASKTFGTKSVYNKQNPSDTACKDEKPTVSSGSRPASTMPPPPTPVSLSHVASSTIAATLNDEELALLLHQELNSSPRVPRVPRVRQLANAQHLGGVQPATPLKRSAANSQPSGLSQKDRSGRKRTREEHAKDVLKGAIKGESKDLQPSDHTNARVNPEEAKTLHEHGIQHNSPVEVPKNCSSLNMGDSIEAGDKKHLSDNCISSLTGFIEEVIKAKSQVSYEDLCEAVLPHWRRLKKPNGDRYASNHYQELLDCLKMKPCWSHLVEQGMKVVSLKKRRRADSSSATEAESDGASSREYLDSVSERKFKGLRREHRQCQSVNKKVERETSHVDDVPKRNQRVRRHRKLAIDDETEDESEDTFMKSSNANHPREAENNTREEEPDTPSPLSEDAVSNYSEEDEEMVVHRTSRRRKHQTADSSSDDDSNS